MKEQIIASDFQKVVNSMHLLADRPHHITGATGLTPQASDALENALFRRGLYSDKSAPVEMAQPDISRGKGTTKTVLSQCVGPASMIPLSYCSFRPLFVTEPFRGKLKRLFIFRFCRLMLCVCVGFCAYVCMCVIVCTRAETEGITLI